MPAKPADLPTVGEIPGFDSTPSFDPETSSALDKMIAEAEAAQKEAAGDEPAPKVDDGKPAEDGKPAGGEPAPKEDGKPADDGKPAGGEPAPKVDDGKPAGGELAPKDFLDEIVLPPHTKPKSGEAFEKVKTMAREKITGLTTEVETLRKKNEELAAAKQLSPEVEKELAELRDFRKRLDVEADPSFKEFDNKVEQNVQAIYKRLLSAGAPQATIDKIKELGGPDKVEWGPILDKMDPISRRAIESKLVENEEAAEKKSEAIKEAKKNADEFLKKRNDETSNSRKNAQALAEAQVKQISKDFPWLTPKVAGDKATAEQKKEIEAYNKMVAEGQQYIKEAIADDSPQMRAILAFAGPELFKARHDYESLKASTSAEITALKASLKETQDLLDKVKGSSTARLRGSSASNDTKTGNEGSVNESPEAALDRLAAEARG